jgi:DNA-binding protein Fis
MSNTRISEEVRKAAENYLDGDTPAGELHKIIIELVERPLYEAVILKNRYNQSAAAKWLGISRGTLRTKLAKYFGDKYVFMRANN